MDKKCKFRVIHFVLESLELEHNKRKCQLSLDRIEQTGFLKNILLFYLIIGNIIKYSTFMLSVYKKLILYKFIAGIVILVFESDTNFQDIKPVSKKADNYDSVIYDTVVIGSGPGGSIAALKSTQKNENVLIIESGKAYSSKTIEHHSLAQTNLQFYKQGMNICYGNIPMLFAEGATYGGGSEVNSGLYFKLTEPYKNILLKESNINKYEWDEAEKRVEKLISVQYAPEGSFDNLKSALVDGSNNFGLICEEIPRWRQYKPVEEHMSMQASYLKTAEENGLSVLTETKVLKIECLVDYINIISKNNNKLINIKAKKIVLSAGTIGTPKILKNSRLINDTVRFNFHPMTRCVVDYGEEVNDGDLFPPYQSWTKDHRFKYGYSVSTYPFVKATLASLGIYKDIPNPSSLVCYFSSTVLESSYGRLLDFNGKMIPVSYISKKDRRKINEGFELLREILKSTSVSHVWPVRGVSPMTTVHVFGSLPIGKNKDIGPSGELIKDPRVKISDASIMPTAPWGNPQAVIMVLNEILMDRWLSNNSTS